MVKGWLALSLGGNPSESVVNLPRIDYVFSVGIAM